MFLGKPWYARAWIQLHHDLGVGGREGARLTAALGADSKENGPFSLTLSKAMLADADWHNETSPAPSKAQPTFLEGYHHQPGLKMPALVSPGGWGVEWSHAAPPMHPRAAIGAAGSGDCS